MMTKPKVKFVLNRKAFQDQILYSPAVGEVCAKALGSDAVVEQSSNAEGGGRIRARVYGSLAGEAANGSLSRRLG